MIKKGIILLLIALLSGGTAFGLMRWYRLQTTHSARIVLDAMPELTWLRANLKLSDEEFEKVKALHTEYRPHCVEMCNRIATAHHNLATFAFQQRELTPEYRNALREHARIHVECQEEMLKHLYRTAALLQEDQATRYLKTMLPYALDFSVSEPENFHAH